MPGEWFRVTLKEQVHDVFFMQNFPQLGKKVYSNSISCSKLIPDIFLMVNRGRKLISTKLVNTNSQLP